jgi:hypothetical protein
MSTTTIKNYPIAPYYDDFDETKNYHRILYRPGYAVQARELTQMQTALQAQIDRFGQYAFKHGSRVVGGKVTINTQYDFIKIDSSFLHSDGTTLNTDGYLTSFVGTTITGTANTGTEIKARVLSVVASDGSDPNTLYIKYAGSAGTARTTSTFAAGEQFASDGATTFYGKVQTTGTPTGIGSSVNIEEGVYFLSGTFVYVPAGELILDKYSNTPSYVVGLDVVESIVDTDQDAFLKDNAQGTPNEAAPGATRYKIATTLLKESLTNLNSANTNYVTLLRVDGGKIQIDETDATDVSSELTTRLARRTFEESGNYAVKPYQLDIKEHLNTTSNNGYKLASEGGLVSKLAIGVEPGVSYVQGFRNENTATNYIVIDKPRDEANSVNVDANATVATPVGNYIKLTESTVRGAPDLSTFSTMNLHNAITQGGSVVGTARVRAMQNIADEIRLYIFDIVMTSGSFSAVRSVSQSHPASGIPFGGDIADATALRYDIGNNGLVFKLPYAAVQKLYNGVTNTTNYTVKRDFHSTIQGGQTTINMTGNGTFVNIDNATMIAVGNGALQTNPTLLNNPVDGAETLTFSTPGANGVAVRAVIDVRITGSEAVEKSKTRQNGTIASGVTASADGSYSLGKADIIRVTAITDATGTNVTERFTLDNGQRDNYYDIGRVTLNPGNSPVSGNLSITFDYYTHAGGDYFTVDSYPSADYATIPTFNSAQGVVQLRDCIDFRPRKDDTGSNFTGTNASISNAPDPNHAISMYLKYYMPRIDKLYITKEGELKVATGVPSDNPKAPAAPEDSMGLYDLKLKPYVFSTSDVIPRLIDNKRYTMKDIGRIDKRVKNLEYYTSLSLLEQQASNTQLFDGINPRTKNGFVVDGFRGHNVGNPSDPDYACAVDKANGLLRAKFDEKNVNLVRKPADSGAVVKNKSILTLPHTSVNYIDQPYSSVAVNVNPYNVFTWSGTLALSPESDEWKDTDVRPDVIINDDGLFNQFVEMADQTGITGTVWNEWETNWTGVETDVSTNRSVTAGTAGNAIVPVFNWWEEDFGRIGQGFELGGLGIDFNIGGNFGIGGGGGGGVGPGRTSITTTTATTVTEQQARTGLTTAISSSTTTRESNNRVVEVNFVPFMRSRKIFFKAELLKPNTRVYAFFNDIDVSLYCKEESFQEFSDRTGVVTYEGRTQHPETPSALISDANGVIEGSFVIPRNNTLQFKTGSRLFKLTDSLANNPSDGSQTTFCEAQFTASGLIESIEKEIISTKVPSLVTTELSDSRVLLETNVTDSVEWIDPLAQTFLIDTAGGIFCKSIQLYMKSKDPSVALRVSIRSVVHGTPTQRIVPGADKVVYPSSVNISEDASAATTVTFDDPIFLAQNQEYAIVLMAQSDLYEAWVAEMGGFDKTNPNNRITKQPYNGVFFTSANASTWTPEQSRDLKFKLNRCSFSGSGAELNLVNDQLPVRRLPLNSMVTTNNSATVKVFHKNHGMYSSGHTYYVTISGAVGFNGIATGNLNGTHTITNTTHDTYEFTAGSSDVASATGSGGGNSVFASENRQMDVVRNMIQSLTVPGTQIRYYMSTYTPNEIAVPEIEILANENIIFPSPKAIHSVANTDVNTKTYNLRCVFTTDRDTLSPVIDLNRASLFTIQNIITDVSSGDELSPTGGNQASRYITKKIELAEEADKIDVYLNVNRPRSANIDLYFRVVEGGSSIDINDVAWQYASPVEPISINDNTSVFKEIAYSIDPGDSTYSASPDSFGTMQFKIVMRSSNSSTVPLVKDFRAIAST